MFRDILSIVLLMLSVAGCGGSSAVSTTSGEPTSVPAASSAGQALVTVHRTGGLAAVQDVVRVAGSGAWNAGTRNGKQTSGQLTPARLSALRALVAAPDWRSASTASSTRSCPDGFVYEVTAAGRTATSNDCLLDSEPTLAELARGVLADAQL